MKRNRIFQTAKYFTPGNRMLHRLRLKQRHRAEQTRNYILRYKTDALALGSIHLKRFSTMRDLWSKHTPKLRLYTLLRISHHIDEPFKSRTLRALKRLFIRHQLHWPDQPRPLIVPFLAPISFKPCLASILRDHIHTYKAQLTPLHWPSVTIVEGKHRQLGDALYNWRLWHKKFLVKPPICPCAAYLALFPSAAQVNGHIAGSLDSFKFADHLQAIASASAKDAVYPAKVNFTSTLDKALTKWSRQNNNAPFPKTTSIVHKLWPSHLQQLKVRPAYQFKHISELSATLQDLLIHCQDHAPTKFCAFCPTLYHDVNKRTFNDKEVFGASDLTPTQLRYKFAELIPPDLLQKYPWGFQFDAMLPSSYLLLKEKKRYQKGRPIISYAGTICAEFFSLLGKLLTDLLPKTYPDTFGHKKIEAVFSAIHSYLLNDPEVESALMNNDDLVGFFVSVPHPRIEAAMEHFTATYFRDHCKGLLWNEIVFTVDTTKHAKHRTIRGRAIQNNLKTRVFFFSDIAVAVRFSLQCSFFENMGSVFFQKQGSSIGSQCSPPICAIVVAHTEYVWIRSYNISTKSAILFIRYVDNRLVCLPKRLASLPEFRRLLSLEFYGAPILLEECGSEDILGFELNLPNRTCKYKFPSQSYQFPSTLTACSVSRLLSGFQSRVHLIIRRTWPRHAVKPSLYALIKLYADAGFHINLLHRTVARILRNLKARVQLGD